MSLPTIPDFFRNKSIFITGGSGFIGKVLIEKLLRSCPDLKAIYLLMRPKRGKSVDERLKTITDNLLFDTLKAQNPQNLQKLKVVEGDVRELGLGISPENRQLLIDQVNIIYHVAASVRFDDPLTDAILMNTRGAREVVKLAMDVKNLNVLVHVSTTYCNSDRRVVDEVLYPPHADWEKTIEIAENVDRQTLNTLTEKFIKPLVNTYTFTKQLAEHVVYDLCNGKIPVVIYRPSIVIATASDPVPGWSDNFNGPVGLLVAGAKGVVRAVYSDPNITADYIPADITIKAIIIATWKQMNKDLSEKFQPSFYNGSSYNILGTTVREMVELGLEISKDVPLNDILWYPNSTVTTCYYNYFLRVIFYQVLPALLLDGVFKLLGRKPILMKIQRKIYTANMAIAYFSLNQWDFINTKCYNLQRELLPSDEQNFAYHDEDVGIYEFYKQAGYGARKYLLKEDNIEGAKRHQNRMWFVAQFFNLVFYLILFWFVFYKIDLLAILEQKWRNMIVYFTTE